jgi:hypothetical protein
MRQLRAGALIGGARLEGIGGPVENRSRQPIVIIRLTCGCVGTGDGEEGPPEPGEALPCPRHESSTAVALAAWVGPEAELPSDVRQWGPYIHVVMLPDYWIEFGFPGLSVAHGRVIIDVGDGKGYRLLRRGERDVRTN